MSPSQDIVMGIFYLTCDFSPVPDLKPKHRFGTLVEALMAYELGKVGIHEKIEVRITQGQTVEVHKGMPRDVPRSRAVVTTVGG